MFLAQIGSGILLAKLSSFITGAVVGLVVGYLAGKGLNPLSFVKSIFSKRE